MLAKLASADDAGKALDSYNPPMRRIQGAARKARRTAQRQGRRRPRPKKKSRRRRSASPAARSCVSASRTSASSTLRKRLKIEGDKNSPVYDEAVVEAVKAFQTQADIGVDGNVGPNTLAALNGEKREAQRPPADPIDTIIVNMERWRWYPRDLGNPHVIVNIPDYRLTLWNDNKVYWTTKIVVGKPGKATPLISAEMKFITVNPTWNVPPSIIENEYLPALQQDPNALDRIGLKLEQAPDGTVRIYQPPGAGNALGRIRFNFPNKFLVYQHDTPDKYLFKKDKRAYSHGCMRVENPLDVRREAVVAGAAEGALHRGAAGEDVRRQRDQHQLPEAHLGASDLSDRLRRRGRQAAVPRRRLWPRCPHDRDPQGQRPQGRRYRDRAAAEPVVQAGAHAGRHVSAAVAATAAVRISSNCCSAAAAAPRRSSSRSVRAGRSARATAGMAASSPAKAGGTSD